MGNTAQFPSIDLWKRNEKGNDIIFIRGDVPHIRVVCINKTREKKERKKKLILHIDYKKIRQQ